MTNRLKLRSKVAQSGALIKNALLHLTIYSPTDAHIGCTTNFDALAVSSGVNEGAMFFQK